MEEAEVKNDKAKNEQLMEYIKKQKLKIKRLETENESLKAATVAAPAATVGGGPWANIASEPRSRQQLAKCAMKFFLGSVGKTRSGQTAGDRRSAFEHWKYCTLLRRSEALAKDLAQSQAATASMEQRIAKLKALLARTHQANQRNLEEFDNLRKAQKEAEGELKATEMKANAELTSLREVVRATSITTAFQYDIDILIQNAGTFTMTPLFD